jgi:hypothetical protein
MAEFVPPENKMISSLKTLKNKILDEKTTIEETMQDFTKILKLNMRGKQLDMPKNPERIILSIEEMLQNPDNPNNKEIIDNFVKKLAKANSIIVLDDEEFDEELDEETKEYIQKEYSKFEKKVLESLFKAFIKEPEIKGRGHKQQSIHRKRGKTIKRRKTKKR